MTITWTTRPVRTDESAGLYRSLGFASYPQEMILHP
jgi:hypothetical protein